jgi:pimeloyl-ACP methyl ester carboxylesterase
MTIDDLPLDDVPSNEPLVLRMIREPEPWVQMAGMMQLPLEMSAYLASVPVLPMLPRGDGHPVLVMPGFMGGDMSTLPLRYHLYMWGYDVRGFGEAPNPGPTRSVLDRMSHRLESIHERTGRTVSLVGWSAGALYARHLARRHPKRVRQAITLAGGLQHRIRTDRSSISFITRFIQRTFDPDFGVQPDFVEGSLPVPSTSIYSRLDGVVRWESCLDVVDDSHENIEVYASHVGIGVNPSVLFVIADRLAQPEDGWRPFFPPPWMRWLYPPAPSWDPARRTAVVRHPAAAQGGVRLPPAEPAGQDRPESARSAD